MGWFLGTNEWMDGFVKYVYLNIFNG